MHVVRTCPAKKLFITSSVALSPPVPLEIVNSPKYRFSHVCLWSLTWRAYFERIRRTCESKYAIRWCLSKICLSDVSDVDLLKISHWKHSRNKNCWQCNNRSWKVNHIIIRLFLRVQWGFSCKEYLVFFLTSNWACKLLIKRSSNKSGSQWLPYIVSFKNGWGTFKVYLAK